MNNQEDSKLVNEEAKPINSLMTSEKHVLLLTKQYHVQRYIYFNDFTKVMTNLANMAEPERWGKKNWVLANFFDMTCVKQINGTTL